MIDGLRVLAVVPARGGSKGIPRKNVTLLGGRPLLAWTAECALGSDLVDRAVLTTDDEEIRRVGLDLGLDAPFLRPAALAQDETSGIDPVIHALDVLKESADLVVLLQPTSPLRVSEDVDNAIRTCVARRASTCVSVTSVEHPPWWTFQVVDGLLVSLLDPASRPARRQDAPPAVRLNGAVYVARCDDLRSTKSFLNDDTVAHEMPAERSVDIDTELDLIVAEALLARRSGPGTPSGAV